MPFVMDKPASRVDCVQRPRSIGGPTTPAVRKRASRPKVRTGCLTCRRRRIKCDEGKPTCRNCATSRIHCDGYTDATVKPRKKRVQRASEALPLLLPKHHDELSRVQDHDEAPQGSTLTPIKSRPHRRESKASSPVLLEPWMTTASASEQEDRYFRVFYEKFASQIAGFYAESDVWGRLMLQASERDTAIRQAISAVGALNITLETVLRERSQATMLTSDTSNNEHHRFALQRYGKAIHELRTAISTPGYSLRNVLLASLLIICFENLHGNHAAAVTQMQSCLSLLRQSVRRPALISTEEATAVPSPIPSEITSPQSANEPPTPVTPISEYIEGDLVRAFGRMDMQFISFDYHQMSRDFNDRIAEGDPDLIPARFTTVTEAQVYYERLARSSMLFLSSLFPPPHRALSASSVQNPAATPRKVGGILNKYIRENNGFTFTDRQYDQTDRYKSLYRNYAQALHPLIQSLRLLPPDDPVFLAAMAIRVWLLSATVLVNCALTPLQTAFDAYANYFLEIVTISRMLLHNRQAIFTFDVGFILQLWVVGCRCRDRAVRSEAISLLLSRPWREGVWDSWLAGTMARCVMEVEEGGRVPADDENALSGPGVRHPPGIGLRLGGDAKGIPEYARVKTTSPKFDMKERKGTLQCFLSSDPHLGELRAVEKELRW